MNCSLPPCGSWELSSRQGQIKQWLFTLKHRNPINNFYTVMWATPASKQSKLSILKPYFESEVDHKSSYWNKNIFQVYGLVYFFVTSEIILVVASRFEFGAEKAD